MTQGRVRPAADGGVDDDARAADNVTLAQLCKGINATAEGVKCHVTHAFLEAIPGTLKDTLFTWVGRIRNARIEGDSAKGDVHLSRAAAVSPNGDLRTYLLTRADDDPKSLGLSAIFTPDRAESRRAGALRIAKVKSVDFVGEAAPQTTVCFQPRSVLRGQRVFLAPLPKSQAWSRFWERSVVWTPSCGRTSRRSG